MMGRRADDGKRGEWIERLRRREKSGLTVAQFCDWEGVSVAAFYNWQKKLRAEDSKSRSTAVIAAQIKSMPSLPRASFLPVRVTQPSPAGSPSSCIEIRLANRVRIFVPSSDANTVQAVIETASRISISASTDIDHDRELVEDATC
jgi:hypothetical protein